MYYTLSLKDMAYAAIIVIGLILFLKWISKENGSSDTAVVLVKRRKQIAAYLGIICAFCVASAIPSISYFINGASTTKEFRDSAQITSSNDQESLGNPKLATLLARGNESNLINYINETGSPEGSRYGSWIRDEIRLDHEGTRDISNIHYTSIENGEALAPNAISSIDQIDEINLNTYVLADDLQAAMKTLAYEYDLPEYSETDSYHLASQPWEDPRGLSFECGYRDDIQWRISGWINKVDTCNGKNAYSAGMRLVRFISA